HGAGPTVLLVGSTIGLGSAGLGRGSILTAGSATRSVGFASGLVSILGADTSCRGTRGRAAARNSFIGSGPTAASSICGSGFSGSVDGAAANGVSTTASTVTGGAGGCGAGGFVSTLAGTAGISRFRFSGSSECCSGNGTAAVSSGSASCIATISPNTSGNGNGAGKSSGFSSSFGSDTGRAANSEASGASSGTSRQYAYLQPTRDLLSS